MKLIVGLGNPGPNYINTRHNVGFDVVDILAENLNAERFQLKRNAMVSEGKVGGEKLLIIKPETYMNLSGAAVLLVAAYYHIMPQDIIVVHDDLDLPPGKLRIKKGGGHGGHNGLKSIFQHLSSPDFIRVKIGIGRPPEGMEVVNYVLSHFNRQQRDEIDPTLVNAADAIALIITDGIEAAMNRYN